MTADAAVRIREFNDFVTGAANTASLAASAAHGEALRWFKDLVIASSVEVEAALGEFADLAAKRKEMVPLIAAYCAAAGKRRDAIVGIAALDDFTALPLLADSIATKFPTEMEALEAEALADDAAAANDGNRAAERARRDALKDRRKLAAARQLRLAEVPVIVLRGLNDLQRRQLMLADNRIALNAGWDLELLRLELTDLSTIGADLSLLGFSKAELSAALKPIEGGLPTRTRFQNLPRALSPSAATSGFLVPIGSSAATARTPNVWRRYWQWQHRG